MTKRILSAALTLALSLALAAPAFAEETESPFSDVPTTHWAIEAIRQAEEERIISGMGYDPEAEKNYFAPDDTLTAAQFATIVTKAFYWRDFGRDPEETWFAPREGEEDWYVFYKEAAEKAGLTEGTGIEDWTAPMTRYQMAVMLYNIVVGKELALPDKAALEAVEITDRDQVPEEFQEAVSAAYAMGLLSGMEDGSFAGDQTLTRAQAAVVFAKLDQALEVKDGPMERFLDKKERSLAFEYLSYRFVRYPGKLGTAYTSTQNGTPHGSFSYLSYVALDGTEANIKSLLPEGYLYDSIYHFDTKDIQFDETGEKLSFITNVQELTDGPSVINLGRKWGDTRIVVNVVTGEMESMEPLIPFDLAQWNLVSEPDSPLTPAPELSVVVKNDTLALVDARPFIHSSAYPGSGMGVSLSQGGICVAHYAALLSDPDFPDSGYGRAFHALDALELPSVTQENFFPGNTPKQREQAGQYFQVLLNGEPVSGDLWWGQGNNQRDLNFTFDQPVELKDGDTLSVRLGLPQESQNQ